MFLKMTTRRWAVLIAVVAFCLLPASFVFQFFFGNEIDDWRHRRAFDATAWRNQGRNEPDFLWPPRLCMVDDLMRRDVLSGMTQDQVVSLLGPPNAKGFPFGAAACDIHYYLGPERGFIRIDSEWLFLKFGPDGRLARQWLYRD